MSEVWNNLAREHGAKAVMNLTIDDATLAEETKRQAEYVFPLIKKNMLGHELNALDFGCGAGRFMEGLTGLVSGTVYGYDASKEMIGLAPAIERVQYLSGETELFFAHCLANSLTFDLIFVWLVFGGLKDWALPYFTDNLVRVLSPSGLLIFADHTTKPDRETWWQFRSLQFYPALFEKHGLTLRRIGECMQLENSVTIYAGRKT